MPYQWKICIKFKIKLILTLKIRDLEYILTDTFGPIDYLFYSIDNVEILF